jgi:Ca2+-binding EF-hand superfamily protein
MKMITLAGAALAALAIAPVSAQPAPGPRGPDAHPVTRADVQSRVQQRFGRIDANRDGFVTEAELRARVEASRAERQQRRGERRAQLFARLDANRDGSISREEFDNRPQLRGGERDERRAAWAERRGQRFARHGGPRGPRGAMGAGLGLRAFAALDSDRDGRVSLAEANARALARFDRVDSNRDGTITMEERRAAREASRARRGG